MAACSGAQSHITDFNIRHELQTLRAQSFGGVDKLKSSLGGKQSVGRIDFDNLRHAGHIHDRAIRGRTGR